MKKTVFFLLLACVLFVQIILPVSAAGNSHNWYCVHVKDHQRPKIGADLAFAEELDGYYLGKDPADKVLYLTFDAGYENGNVAKVLDVLKEESVSGAFFVLGNLIRHDTDLVRRMAAEGHLVCNHTVRHKDMTGFDDAAFEAELRELETIAKETAGIDLASYYRPPEGKFSRENLACAQKMGYQTIFWSFAYPDWDNAKQPDPARALRIITENFHNGEVLLLHPTSATNAAILRDVIREARAQGYRFGTLDELTNHDENRSE